MIIVKQAARYFYECSVCSNDYVEQRHADEQQFIETCTVPGCSGLFNFISSEDFTYEVEVLDSVEVTDEPSA